MSTQRLPSDERRRQIVAAVLDLLADEPLDTISTRRLAGRLGFSQPALFRHFPSRDALLVAVVEHARSELEGIVAPLLAAQGTPPEQLEALARGLAEYVERRPGLPRLLFGGPGLGEGPVETALRDLVRMQRALVISLIRGGQSSGLLTRRMSPEHGATLYVGMLQGLILQWQLDGRTAGGLVEQIGPLVALWLDGARARTVEPEAQAPTIVTPPSGPRDEIVVLDVRPMLARGEDPLTTVLDLLDSLAPGDVLHITAPFRPGPLVTLLGARRHGLLDWPLGEGAWSLAVLVGGSESGVADLTDLEPPLPLERVLEAVALLEGEAVYLARLPRTPRLLFPQLERRGLGWVLREVEDGSVLMRVGVPR